MYKEVRLDENLPYVGSVGQIFGVITYSDFIRLNLQETTGYHFGHVSNCDRLDSARGAVPPGSYILEVAMIEALAARASDYVMPDVSRISGVSGWIQAAGIFVSADPA